MVTFDVEITASEFVRAYLVSAALDVQSADTEAQTPGAGGHRSDSTSFSAIGATFVPTFATALLFLAIFVLMRQRYRNIYAPRTYMSTVPEKYDLSDF